MSRMFRLVHSAWIAFQLHAPPFVHKAVLPRLHELKEVGRLLAWPFLPVYQMQGEGQGGPLTVHYVGLGFAKPFLRSILFAEKPAERFIGRIPLWRYGRIASLAPSDLIIVEAAKHVVRLLPPASALVAPDMVDHVLDVRGSWQDVCGRFHNKERRDILRLKRKYGYECELSPAPCDLDKFYRQMYAPTAKSRHGELSSPMSINQVRQYCRAGFLFRTTRQGDWVAGLICHRQHRTLIFDFVGVRNGDARLVQEGAEAATYYDVIQWANQQGYDAVSFLGSGSRLNSGLFQHKRRWGTTISVPSDLHRWLWIRVCENTPGTSCFLKDNPFVVIDRAGELHGLIIVDDPDNVPAETQKEWIKRYATPGLTSLLIRPSEHFVAQPLAGDDHQILLSKEPPSGESDE